MVLLVVVCWILFGITKVNSEDVNRPPSGGCAAQRSTLGTVGSLSAGDALQTTTAFSVDYLSVTGEEPGAWGTNVWWSDQDADLWTSRWRELGLRTVRLSVPHAVVEPSNDNGDPDTPNMDGFILETPVQVSAYGTRTATLREWFVALRDTPSLDAMIYFPYLAPWLSDNPAFEDYIFPAAPCPPNDLEEYREFVEVILRYLVEQLGFPPERLLVEAMNEPDLNCGQDPAVRCFWQNWNMDDIADVVRVTCETARAVDPRIRVVGLAECCGTDVVRAYLDNYPESSCLDGLSYHYYAPSDVNLSPALNRAAALEPYGRPLYLDEYGSFHYLSNGVPGGLWHSWTLSVFWEASIAPLQYPVSEIPQLDNPYRSMGLFYDWTGDWQRKPAYWVYANFYQLVTGGETLALTGPSSETVRGLATRTTGEPGVALWVTQRGDLPVEDQRFVVQNFPAATATVRVYDNLVGPSPVLTATISGDPLVFTQTLPARSSRTFVVQASGTVSEPTGLSIDPESTTRIAGERVGYALTAHYEQGDVDVTDAGTYAIDAGAGGRWNENVYTTELSGTWTVTGTYVAQHAQASLRVWVPSYYLYLPLVLRA